MKFCLTTLSLLLFSTSVFSYNTYNEICVVVKLKIGQDANLKGSDLKQNLHLQIHNPQDIEWILKDELDIVSVYNYPNPYRGTRDRDREGRDGITFRYKSKW